MFYEGFVLPRMSARGQKADRHLGEQAQAKAKLKLKLKLRLKLRLKLKPKLG